MSSWAPLGAGEEEAAETGATRMSAGEGTTRTSAVGTVAAGARGAIVVDVAAVVGADEGADTGMGAMGIGVAKA